MMTHEQAADLVEYIRAHSRNVQVATLKAQRSVPRSQTWVVTAMVRAATPSGETLDLQGEFKSHEDFVASEFHDALMPLRQEVAMGGYEVARAKARLRERIDQTLRALRDTADDIERDAANLGDHEYDSPERLAERVVSALLWATPNMQLQYLPREGRDIEQASKRLAAAELALSNAEMAQVLAVPFIVAQP